MTQELTPEQRLTQIEKILQSAIKLSHSNTSKIDNLTEKVEANTEAIKVNNEAIARLTNRVDCLTEKIATATDIFLDSMREMQNEIKGLKVENRRIMEHLFGKESLIS